MCQRARSTLILLPDCNSLVTYEIPTNIRYFERVAILYALFTQRRGIGILGSSLLEEMLRSVGHDGIFEGLGLFLQLLVGDACGTAQVGTAQDGTAQDGLLQVGPI
jgi:hypothetical protein